MSVAELLAGARVVPVVTIERLEEAVPLARAIREGGLSTLEITLRTPVALEAIAAVAAEVPELGLGAGTVCEGEQVEAARAAGARFLVTPATTAPLLEALEESGMPFLPGVATASEVLRLLERGHTQMKLFPAEPLGGTALLRALAGPFPAARFCPTGGITLERAPEYLALPNVVAVGSSWVAARDPRHPDWAAVAAAAAVAASLKGDPV